MNLTLQSYTRTPPNISNVLENPVTGERITFLATSEETEGRLHQYRLELPPGSSAAKHLHPYQQKCLKVMTGELRVWLNDLEHVLKPNEDIVILPGTAHTWRNNSETSVVVTLRPALNSEELLKARVTLAQDGKTNERGLPKALHYAAFARAFKNEILFIHPLQQVLQAIFATFSKLLFNKQSQQGESHELPAHHRRPFAP